MIVHLRLLTENEELSLRVNLYLSARIINKAEIFVISK